MWIGTFIVGKDWEMLASFLFIVILFKKQCLKLFKQLFVKNTEIGK